MEEHVARLVALTVRDRGLSLGAAIRFVAQHEGLRYWQVEQYVEVSS